MVIGIVLVALGGFGAWQAAGMDKEAFSTYANMFTKVVKTGDPAKGMIDRYEVNDDIETEDVAETIKTLAGDYNLLVVGDTKMFTMPEFEGQADKVMAARNISLCALPIAKKMLQFSPEFGGFMPCRIMIITMGDGKRYLLTMSLDLMLHGGAPLPPEVFKMASEMRTALTEIPARAAIGDW